MKLILSLLLFIAMNAVYAQEDTVVQRIFLIGDAGKLVGGRQPVLDWLAKKVDWNDERNVALFLGDNVYEDGLTLEGDAQFPLLQQELDYQIGLVKGKKGRAYFVNGNHDWKGGKIGGWQRANNQTNYINSLNLPNVQSYPLNGCPGPIPVELNDKVVLVMINTQWFLHVHDKPGPESACEARTIDEFTSELKQIAETHPNQMLLLMMHHPMYTYGVHGGAYPLKTHLFPFAEAIKGLYVPLPVLGSVYPIARGVFGSLQDSYHPLYRNMISEIEKAVKEHQNVVTAAGHEHSLQLIMKDSTFHIVSGSAAKLTRLREGRLSLFSRLDYGFAFLEIRKSGKAEVKFYSLSSRDLSDPIFVNSLKQIVPVTPKATVDTLRNLPEFVTASASNSIIKDNTIRDMFSGHNYRDEWNAPVKIAVLDLLKESGGMKPVKQTGGRKAATLTLQDKGGKFWTLRAIEEFPQSSVPADLRSSLLTDKKPDGITASYPFASLSIAPMAHAAGLVPMKRKLVYVPDDPRLERFRSNFKNSIAILEEKIPPTAKSGFNTEEVVLRIQKDNSITVDQKAVLRARLLDNFIMDFDRHEGQWGWVNYNPRNENVFYPVTREHDQAFFMNEGIIPFLAVRFLSIPEIQGFKSKISNVVGFNRLARNVDRFFLNSLSEEEWVNEIDLFVAAMTDSVIETSLSFQPAEVRRFNASNIASTLKRRREFLKEEMLNYYRFLSKEVNIVGSAKPETFVVEGHRDGKLTVRVERKASDTSEADIVYKRTFLSGTTKEIRLFGLGSADSFLIRGERTPIVVRITGGSGEDKFINHGVSNVTVYDDAFEANEFEGNGFTKILSSDPELNLFNWQSFKYNTRSPGIAAQFNVDDGFYLGGALTWTLHKFRKDPFSQQHDLRGNYAFKTNSFDLRYTGDFTDAFGTIGLNISAEVKAPQYTTNYFGRGNETIFDKSKPGGASFYNVKYNIATFSLHATRQLQSWFKVGLGPILQFYNVPLKSNAGHYVSGEFNNEPSLDNMTINPGLEGLMEINSRNNTVLPTRGAYVKGYLQSLLNTGTGCNMLTRLGLDVRIYSSIVQNTRYVFATRFGYGRNFGQFQFLQAQYLSGRDNLRGYRKDRFAGRAMLFNNSELRFKLSDFTTYLYPGSLGFLLFHDIGRVWIKEESSSRWHNSYGAGLWVAPIQRFVFVGTLAFSREQKALPLLSFGFQF